MGTRRLVGVVAALVVALVAAPLHAQRSRTPRSPEVRQLIGELDAAEPDRVRQAIEGLGLMGDASGAAAIEARIRRGLPPELLDVAIEALAVLGRADSGSVLFELLSHRRGAVRARAARAIAALGPRGADSALSAALRDADPEVRAAAAEALGEIGATSALDTLFLALERGVPEAGMAIGRLARPPEVERFLGLIGAQPFAQLLPALSEMLHRENLAERSRLSIVHRLSELATPEVAAFFEGLLDTLPGGERSQVRRAAADALQRIGR